MVRKKTVEVTVRRIQTYKDEDEIRVNSTGGKEFRAAHRFRRIKIGCDLFGVEGG